MDLLLRKPNTAYNASYSASLHQYKCIVMFGVNAVNEIVDGLQLH